jgi:hypothetical protein
MVAAHFIEVLTAIVVLESLVAVSGTEGATLALAFAAGSSVVA